MNTFVKVMHASTCNCAACASVPTLGIEMPYNIKENCLAVACPKVAAMLSEKDKHLAFDVTTGSGRKLTFVCPDCKQKFEAAICNVVRSVGNGTTGCPVCAGRKVVPGINDLASQYPEVATMWSSKNKLPASEVATQSGKKAFFKCHNCGQEFEARIHHVVDAVDNGHTGCPICAGLKVVSSINDLASQCPEAAAMWSSKNKLSASEVAVKSSKKAFFKCRDCGQEFEAAIQNVVRSVGNGFTGCYDCKMRRKNAISKPECFVVRLMLAFAGENGIANPFSDVRSILGENSLLGLDFVDHIQKLCGEYNGVAWHGDDEHVVRDRFKFEAAHKAVYTMIRIQEPGLEVLDPKYDIVMPEGFRDSGGRYNAEIMEEVGRKVIHLLEEIYGRKASPEIWALNNFKEFEIWYDANKKELEANARQLYTEQVKRGVKLDKEHYLKRFPVWFSIFNGNTAIHLSTGKSAAICGNFLKDEELLNIGREQLYWTVGKNPFGQSLIYGEGYNYPQMNSFSSGEMTGEMPVGIRTLGNDDIPYWPQTNNACYKEVWVTSAGKWLSLIAEY